jgi:thiol-disulfide isomerase/thioredoxin
MFVKTIKLVSIATLFVLVGAGCSGTSTDDSATKTEQSVFAPKFALQDYNGNTVSSDDFVGRPMIINSWAAWCPFCRKELPDFVTVQKEFENEVVFVAIDRQESLKTAKGYTDEIGITDDLVFLLDPKDSFYRSIGGFSMPETIFVNEEGKIEFHKRGVMDLAEIRDRTKELIE